MDVVGRAEQRRQRQNQNKNSRRGEAGERRGGHDPNAAAENDAAGRQQTDDAAGNIRPGLALEPAGHRQQNERGRQLAEIERGQRRADPFVLPDAAQIIGNESIGREISGVDGAEHDAEPPDQHVAPVRPPFAANWRAAIRRRARRQRHHDKRDDDDRHAPENEAPLPAAADERQHQNQHESNGQNFADQQAVGVNRGGKADAVRQPGAHRRRHGDLHDGDTAGHDDGHGIEPQHIRQQAAQGAADGGEQEADDQRRAHAEFGDQQRARYGGERQQHRWQASQNADLGGAHV